MNILLHIFFVEVSVHLIGLFIYRIIFYVAVTEFCVCFIDLDIIIFLMYMCKYFLHWLYSFSRTTCLLIFFSKCKGKELMLIRQLPYVDSGIAGMPRRIANLNSFMALQGMIPLLCLKPSA